MNKSFHQEGQYTILNVMEYGDEGDSCFAFNVYGAGPNLLPSMNFWLTRADVMQLVTSLTEVLA